MGFFADWETHKKESISKTILWEYDTQSPRWDWRRMDTTVVRRVLEYGREEDYYAMFQLYGGFGGVREIVRRIPKLHRREICWACALLKMKEEELLCCKRELSRKKLLGY